MTITPSSPSSLLVSLFAFAFVGACGGASSQSPSPSNAEGNEESAASHEGGGDGNAGKTSAESKRPPPLSAPDKKEAWKGRDATVYEIPSLGVLEVIAPTESSGVDAEYQYLSTLTCGGGGHWTTKEQSLLEKGDRQYDVLRCVCSAGGQTKDFTFDITQYFGAGFQ